MGDASVAHLGTRRSLGTRDSGLRTQDSALWVQSGGALPTDRATVAGVPHPFGARSPVIRHGRRSRQREGPRRRGSSLRASRSSGGPPGERRATNPFERGRMPRLHRLHRLTPLVAPLAFALLLAPFLLPTAGRA